MVSEELRALPETGAREHVMNRHRILHKVFHWFTSDLVYSLKLDRRQCSKCNKREKLVGSFISDGTASHTSYSWTSDCMHDWQDHPKRILNNHEIETLTLVEKKCTLCRVVENQ